VRNPEYIDGVGRSIFSRVGCSSLIMNASTSTSEPERQETRIPEVGGEMMEQDLNLSTGAVGTAEVPAPEGLLQGGEDGAKEEVKGADPLLVKPPEQANEDIENGQAQEDGPLLPNDKKIPDISFYTSASDYEDEANPREKAFSEDIYSLIYTAKVRGLAFWFAIAIFIMQITILLLICEYQPL
jgi:hypothetical protein